MIGLEVCYQTSPNTLNLKSKEFSLIKAYFDVLH